MMRIKFNAQTQETACRTSVEFFKSVSADADDVWIINGFATREMVELREGDELFCIPKNTLPPREALDAMMRARHTPKLHDKLRAAKVAVCGLGGLGSHIAIMLARSGLGGLELIDFDVVEPSNLNRQAYRVSDLGRLKTEALREQIMQINPYTEVKIHTLRVEEGNLKELFCRVGIVCEAFDRAEAKAMLAQNFHKIYPEKILICASGLAGYGQSNAIQTRKIAKNFFVCGDLVSGAKVGRGLMAPRVNICAAHQANLVLELLG